MKSFFNIFFFVFFWGSFSCIAQEEVKLEVQDTLTSQINPLSPAKAAFYSALIPGLGQAYNKKYWKIPIVYVGIGVGLYAYKWNDRKYNQFRNEYKRRLAGTNNPDDAFYGDLSNDVLIRGQRFHQRNRDLSALITAGIYILNIIDANVDAHLLQFNVNEKLTIAPDLYQNEIDFKYNTGVKLTYNF